MTVTATAMRIIPAIDIMGGEVVRLYRGDPHQKTVYGSDPVAAAREWERQGAHMLHVVDLDATLSLGNNTGMIRKVAGSVSIPVQAAGGLRTEAAVGEMLDHAERAVIGTLALDGTALRSLSGRYGDRLVVSVDHDNGRVVTHGWRQDSGMGLVPAINRFMEAGVTEFLVTNVSRDGTLAGPDLEGLALACGIKGSRVIASGGISGVSDVRAVSGYDPYGVILGKALYEGRITIGEALRC